MINIYRVRKFKFIKGIILVFLMVSYLGLFASSPETENHENTTEKYNAGDAIIEHIVDAYS